MRNTFKYIYFFKYRFVFYFIFFERDGLLCTHEKLTISESYNYSLQRYDKQIQMSKKKKKKHGTLNAMGLLNLYS